MKKKISIVLAMMMLLAFCAPAFAGEEEIVNVGTAQMTRGEWDRLKAMVAGKPVPKAKTPMAETKVDLGVVELSQADVDQLRSMIDGTYVASRDAGGQRQEMVDAGVVIMSRAEFESIKQQVSGHLHEVQSLVAGWRLP